LRILQVYLTTYPYQVQLSLPSGSTWNGPTSGGSSSISFNEPGSITLEAYQGYWYIMGSSPIYQNP